MGEAMKTTAIAALCTVLAGPALAATVSVSSFTKDAYNAALGSGSYVTENFESYSEGNVSGGFSTSVGTFYTMGGTGSGGTVTNADFANDGSELAVRDGNVYGRVSTTKTLSGDRGDDMFLDSNDTYGIFWNVSTGSLFDKIVLTLTDATDVGAIMKIGGTHVSEISLSGLSNGAQKIVEISFAEAQKTANIYFFNTNSKGGAKLNDGFSLDDISVSEVPLPASALLLLGGLGGLSVMRRKKKA